MTYYLHRCRLFLSPYDLTPTYKLVHNKYSVKYYLNLVLVDEEDRRYFKQQVPPHTMLSIPCNTASTLDCDNAGKGPVMLRCSQMRLL